MIYLLKYRVIEGKMDDFPLTAISYTFSLYAKRAGPSKTFFGHILDALKLYLTGYFCLVLSISF